MNTSKVERLKPLAEYWATWRRLPDISQWVLRTVRHGYTIQFWKGPPPFSKVLPTTVCPGEASILSQEIVSLLEKGAVEEVPPTQIVLLCPKKDGGLCPILDLRCLNLALRVSKFKMLTVKSILTQIQSEDWFVTIVLKDAYFHIQIVKRHRKFLRFAFEGKAYQFCALPFGLALAPRMFTKCMDAVLDPLVTLNYLDDWLILAQSQDQALSHRDLLLDHLRSLGLLTNLQKSVLLPCQQTTFLGVDLDLCMMQARLSPARVQSIQACLSQFKAGHLVHVGLCLRLLGLMAAVSPVVQLGLLHMRPFQWWAKSQNLSPCCHPLCRITVTRKGFRALSPWVRPQFLQKGVQLGTLCLCKTITTDASLMGWGWSGRLNSGKDLLSRQSLEEGEWRLHPQVVDLIWQKFGRAEVDLFASSMTTHCPLWFSLSPSSPLDLDTLAHEWPRTNLYAFPPVRLLPVILFRVRSDRVERSETRSIHTGSGHDLASSTGIMEVMGVAPEQSTLMCSGLSAEITNTIINSRAPSTRCLYAFKWKLFASWCRQRSLDPFYCPIGSVLEFLQSRFSEGVTPATLKVYVAAISAEHALVGGVSVGRHPLVSCFMQGSRWLRPFNLPARVPSWDLSIVLEDLKGHSFKPLESVSEKLLTLKMVLLVALSSLKRVADLQALSISPSCMDFAPGLVKVFLRPRPDYVPNVTSNPFHFQQLVLEAFSPANAGSDRLSLSSKGS
ncbi:uncharacterized protein LOC109076134 [Cyprinus carpio]|uniref:Uncharacterized protein LOC109076134 n=1 Tax=Cyprinus carpio TaxID=7962 RepID=A0A9R0A2V2_CYPCA|nr:uncharacterized protein LOC109076134 [Cyprinus carpio]